MLDVDITASVTDRLRRFDLAVRLHSDAPVIAFFGPSGAGKSLTLQSIAGLLRPASGHVRVDGRTLFDASRGIDVPASRRSLGYLFQDYALFPHLSVRANVAFGLTSWRRRTLAAPDALHVQALLDSFGLAGLAESRPSSLSGGQQQRVALARALACRPSLLLLDEPFAALNPLLRESLRTELAAARSRWNVPMLMISHDIDDVLALADVACVFDDGRIVRQIDLRNEQSRAIARHELSPLAPNEQDPRRSRLRRMLLDAIRPDPLR
jgi:molybdate transport system ATP-binding protein